MVGTTATPWGASKVQASTSSMQEPSIPSQPRMLAISSSDAELHRRPFGAIPTELRNLVFRGHAFSQGYGHMSSKPLCSPGRRARPTTWPRHKVRFLRGFRRRFWGAASREVLRISVSAGGPEVLKFLLRSGFGCGVEMDEREMLLVQIRWRMMVI